MRQLSLTAVSIQPRAVESLKSLKNHEKCEEYMKIHENRIPKSVVDCRIRRAYVRNFILKARREMKDMK